MDEHARSFMRLVPLYALFGVTLVWSAPFGTTEASVFTGLSAYPDAIAEAHLLLVVSFTLSCVALTVLGKVLVEVRARRALVWTCAVLMSLGMLAGSLPAFGSPLPLLFAGAVMRGAAGSFLFAAWIEDFSKLEGREVGVALGSALVLYGIAGMTVPGLAATAPMVAAALLTALLLVGCWACLKVARLQKVSEHTLIAPEPMTRLGWASFIASNTVYGFAYGILLWYYGNCGTTALYGAFALAALVLVTLLAACPALGDLSRLYRIYALVVGALLGVAAIGSFEGMLAAVLAGGWAAQMFFTIVVFIDAEYLLPGRPWLIGGVALCCASAGIAVASRVASQLPQQQLVSSVLMVTLLFAILFLAVVFLPDGVMWRREWGFSSFAHSESRELFITRRCSELTAEYHLTAREFEVLELLARKQSNAKISTVLVLSPYTTKTHIRNIYSKLGIHSKEELYELIDPDNALR